jgi:hypothetical protein
MALSASSRAWTGTTTLRVGVLSDGSTILSDNYDSAESIFGHVLRLTQPLAKPREKWLWHKYSNLLCYQSL